jgi:phosphate transport system substrate-binding protein
MKTRIAKILGLVLILAVVLPVANVMAQGGEDPIELPEVDPLSVTGDIAIAGSSTVEPVTIAMAARFNDDGFAGNIAVAETGTSAGFERFCAEGSTDINNASRPVKDSEIENCAAVGRENVLEFYIGIDAITIAVVEGFPVTELKRSELISIFTGEVTAWGDLNEDWAELGDISLFIPGVDSGTFMFFGEAVLGEKKGPWATQELRFDAMLSPNPTTSENDFTLIEGIQGTEGGVGYFGFAYYVQNEDTLDAIAIADDVTFADDDNLVVIPEEEWEAEGISYVVPSRETAESGDYLLSRPLFIYSDAGILAEKPQVAAFINYYLTNAVEVVQEEGYFPVSTETLNASKQMWLDAVGE